MLPLVCNDAAAILLLFDLSKPETLDSIRVWHQKARERNKCATLAADQNEESPSKLSIVYGQYTLYTAGYMVSIV